MNAPMIISPPASRVCAFVPKYGGNPLHPYSPLHPRSAAPRFRGLRYSPIHPRAYATEAGGQASPALPNRGCAGRTVGLQPRYSPADSKAVSSPAVWIPPPAPVQSDDQRAPGSASYRSGSEPDSAQTAFTLLRQTLRLVKYVGIIPVYEYAFHSASLPVPGESQAPNECYHVMNRTRKAAILMDRGFSKSYAASHRVRFHIPNTL